MTFEEAAMIMMGGSGGGTKEAFTLEDISALPTLLTLDFGDYTADFKISSELSSSPIVNIENYTTRHIFPESYETGYAPAYIYDGVFYFCCVISKGGKPLYGYWYRNNMPYANYQIFGSYLVQQIPWELEEYGRYKKSEENVKIKSLAIDQIYNSAYGGQLNATLTTESTVTEYNESGTVVNTSTSEKTQPVYGIYVAAGGIYTVHQYLTNLSDEKLVAEMCEATKAFVATYGTG